MFLLALTLILVPIVPPVLACYPEEYPYLIRVRAPAVLEVQGINHTVPEGVEVGVLPFRDVYLLEMCDQWLGYGSEFWEMTGRDASECGEVRKSKEDTLETLKDPDRVVHLPPGVVPGLEGRVEGVPVHAPPGSVWRVDPMFGYRSCGGSRSELF